MSAKSALAKKLAIAGTLGAAAYGGIIGVMGEPKRPTNQSDAEKQGNLGHLLLNMGRDVAIGAADDLAAIAFLNTSWFKRRVGQRFGALVSAAQGAFMIGGSSVAGAIAGHDFMNFVAARKYLGQHDDLSRSQQMIPDARIGAINGFQSGGMAAMQRKYQTGIGSPAAGGIFYRMWHNPFADELNRATQPHDNQRAEDPRGRALAYGWVGGHLAMLATMRMGAGRAALAGLLTGTSAGLYGIYSAHNPDMRLNARAVGDLALGIAPTVTAASLLYGLSSIKGRGIGRFMRRGLARATYQARKSGAGLGIGAARAEGWLSKIHTQARIAAEGSELTAHLNALGTSSHAMWQRMTGRTGPLWAPNSGAMIAGALTKSEQLTTQTVGAFDEMVGHGIRETGHARTRWERSLGIGHLLVFAPHQAFVVADVMNIAHSHKSKATSSMPSNRSVV